MTRAFMPLLYIFSGLPGVGKTTLAKLLARHLRVAYVRIDTIEQALRDLVGIEVQAEGYKMAYRIADDALQMGVDVIADSCNPIEASRTQWERVACGPDSSFLNIEIICSDKAEHRLRVETRLTTVEGLTPPTWKEIESRVYEPWQQSRIVIDTAGRTEQQSFAELLEKLAEAKYD